MAGSPALTVIKYSSLGTELWARTFQRETSMVNTARALAVSSTGDVYLTGQVSEDCPEGICRYDLVTLKYNPVGELQWVRYYTRSGDSDEQRAEMTLDSSGNILIAAASVDTSGENILVVKYSPLGALEWAVVYDGISSSYDSPRAIAVDHNDNVIVAGTSWNNAEEFNYCAVKYSPSGQQLWSAEYNRAHITRDFASGLAVDSHGDIYVTGASRFGYLGNDTCTTVKLNAQGELVWSAAYSRPDTGIDNGEHVFVDTAGNVYVTGSSVARNGWDYFAIKYRQSTVGVEEETQNRVPRSYALRQNYPNPFNPATTISFSLPSQSFVSLRVFDALGREVSTLLAEELPPGSYEQLWNAVGLASGVYYYRLQAGSLMETKKLILLK